jgi:quercetin dioxygenase-like cupin family protein
VSHNHDHEGSPDPVEVFGDIETEAHGLAYGAMVFTVKAGGTTEPHSHASEETWWIRSGNAVAKFGGQDHELRPGTRISVPPNLPHTIVNGAAEDLTVVSFWWREAIAS